MEKPNRPDPADAFRAAVGHVGTQAAMASLIGVTQSAISKILAASKPCPHDDGAVLKVEEATGISRHDLRPDLYPREDGPTAPRDLEPAR